jgi:putative transposase
LALKEQSRLSLSSYNGPRMTEKLKGVGVDFGHPLTSGGLPADRERGRVGRLMRKNGIVVERTRELKVDEGQKMFRGSIFPMTHGQ